ncbi:Glucose-6-phosphate isomerase [hydrothermal vent metagenome]|uniref:glucose-6-phosphate isomerase n=1 Tax=hydrothermal vent metagenome TaxID=652676 RepID=A0A1W1BMR9_9ZZZZ
MIEFSAEFKVYESDIKNLAFDKVRDEAVSSKVGYYSLPKLSKQLLLEAKDIDTSKYEQIVVIGIGGSSLGIKAIEAMLKLYTPNRKKILYLENLDPIVARNTLQKIEYEKACFFVISKSGSTIETTSLFKTVIEYFDVDLKEADNFFVITDEGSALSCFAKEYNIREFHIPDNVGGRFSVLSAVGVIPLTFAGYDMFTILDEADRFLGSFFKGNQCHIIDKAYYYYKNRDKYKMNILFSYSSMFEEFNKWYVQLWGESLGKRDRSDERVGLTPIALIGSVDQHSFLQLIIEGPKDKTVTFIKVDDFKIDLSIPDISLPCIEKTDYVNGVSFNELINAQCEATKESITQSGVKAVDMISLSEINEQNIGVLIIYFELLTSLVGAMLEIDTYNQPGVELGKDILKKRFA